MSQAIFVHQGRSIDYTPSSAVAAGAVVVQGSLVGVAERSIAANALGALSVAGVFDLAHAADAVTAGAAVYWDADGNPVGGTAGSGAATVSSGGNTFTGYAVAAAAETDGRVRVALVNTPSVTVNHYGPLNNLIADPGDGKAIPVTASGRVEISIADKGSDETNTLAAPTFGGQQLLISCKATAADDARVITVTGCEDGDTITLDAAAEAVLLIAVAKGAGYAWRVAADPDSLVTTA